MRLYQRLDKPKTTNASTASCPHLFYKRVFIATQYDDTQVGQVWYFHRIEIYLSYIATYLSMCSLYLSTCLIFNVNVIVFS